MRLAKTKSFTKKYQKLPKNIQKKADKQFIYLLNNYHHHSLRTRKMSEDIFEGRIDYHYRFAFLVKDEVILLLSIGPHDEGLGKK